MKESGVGPAPGGAVGVALQHEQGRPVDPERRALGVAVEDDEADHVPVEGGRLVEVCDPERGAADTRLGRERALGGSRSAGRGIVVAVGHRADYGRSRVQRVGRGSRTERPPRPAARTFPIFR
ncbi:hypothetical protein C466_06404 [Halorubrum distributum JCM 10118]|uniref:Uncharacterized protein n=1 Tax=Halorubrum distributum JCM 10118 TaxID=1227468 RepID=M0F2F2_9EURY|nr:hypothetical protein C466_06404 [Halorubrum distributum JCM 10118]